MGRHVSRVYPEIEIWIHLYNIQHIIPQVYPDIEVQIHPDSHRPNDSTCFMTYKHIKSVILIFINNVRYTLKHKKSCILITSLKIGKTNITSMKHCTIKIKMYQKIVSLPKSTSSSPFDFPSLILFQCRST